MKNKLITMKETGNVVNGYPNNRGSPEVSGKFDQIFKYWITLIGLFHGREESKLPSSNFKESLS